MRQALGPGALGKPRGSGWRGRWEGGSGWETHVNPWLFHFNVWQNSLQIKKKSEKKILGFPDSSVDKESACNAGDPCSITGSGRSSGEEIGYPLQYSWASLVAQLVKNLSAMWETWVWSLAWEDYLEKGKATHPHILAWRIPWTE